MPDSEVSYPCTIFSMLRTADDNMVVDGGCLESAARDAWATRAVEQRWTLWARLSWAKPVSEIAASRMIEQWANRMVQGFRGSAIMVGLHDDTERRHAHALIFLPKRVVNPTYPRGVTILGWCWPEWLSLEWRHGAVWAEWFSPRRSPSGPHGTGKYLARFPGSVMQYGKAPPP